MKKVNRFSKLITTTIALAVVLFACVDDEFDTPPVRQIPVGNVYTISDVKDLFDNSAVNLNTGTGMAYLFDEDASIYGTVTMDNETDNSYRTFYIQDNSGAIAVYQDVSGGIYIGDSVRIYLKDLVVMQYSNLYQLNSEIGDGVNVDSNVVKMGFNVERTPEAATIEEILNNKDYYQGRLVKINDVQFVDTDTAETFASPETLETENRLLQDDTDNQILVRTSGYANFAGFNIPNGSGSLIAIVGQYNNDMQLYIRKLGEVEMDNPRFDINTGGGTGDGSGTFDDPYNVAEAISNTSATDVWVEGYLVGVYETKDASGNDLTDFVPSFTSPFYTTTNVIIADSETETDISNCMVIQLQTGEIRNVTNLSENASNLGKLVKYKGDRLAYFGEEGLKNVNGYWFEGSGIVPATGFFEESFSTSLGDFTQYSVTGSQVWEHSSSYSCAMMSGYANGAYANDDWLISPAMDLTSRSNVTLNFVHAIGYGNYSGIEDELKVFVSDDYSGSGDPSSATWVELTFDMPANLNDYFAWTNSGDVDLSAYDGQNNIYFAFNYTCGSSSVSTWEIKDVVVSEGEK